MLEYGFDLELKELKKIMGKVNFNHEILLLFILFIDLINYIPIRLSNV